MADKLEPELFRMETILRGYENGKIDREPDIEALSQRFDVSTATIESDLRKLRRFMRSNEYRGDKTPIYPFRDSSGKDISKETDRKKDWKTAIT